MEVFVKGKGDYTPEYSRQRFSGDSTKTQFGESEDTDFNDVFGGPPKRFSMQERYSFGDSEEDDKAEKPVFGEESSTRRRRQGNDFFDDIFRVDESTRRTDNLIGSNPGSRIMSPARTTDNTHLEGSLPAKTTKFPEYPTFASPNHSLYNIDGPTNGLNSSHSSSASLSRFSGQAIRGHEEIKTEALPVFRQSPLSRQASFGGQSSRKDTKSMDSNNNNQFHFSIYKWPGKGVPMVIPLVGRNNFKTKNITRNDSRGREVKSQENEKASVVLEAARLNVKTEQLKPVDEVGIVKKSEKEVSLKMEKPLGFEVKPLSAWITDEVEQREMNKNKSINPKKTQSDAGKNEKKNDGARIDSNRDNLHEYSLQGNVQEVKEKKSTNPEMTHSDAAKNATKSEGSGIGSNRENLIEDSLQGAAVNSQPPRSLVKGKVKDFVHIFNQEVDSSTKADFQIRNSSSSWKAVDIDQTQNEVSLNAKVDENLNKDETQQNTSTKTSHHTNEQFPTKGSYSSESLNQDSKISVENSDDPFEDNFLVQELSDDVEKATQIDEGSEDMKVDIDAKIRQWSFGRKGNIRSLLSTLQLVLWPGSGWKAVPLMDLIEANSVKRAYQKALLRLHPDKLQQKGADSHHKYIAEKVFDILQEAWDHFNTLAPI